MSILIKAGSGLVAGVVAGALGLAFFPRVEPSALKPRKAVEKPQFVVSAPPSTSPIVRAAATVAVASETPAAKAPPAPVVKLTPAPEASRAAAPPAVVAKAEPPKPEAPKAEAPKSDAAKAAPTPVATVAAPTPAATVAEARATATTDPAPHPPAPSSANEASAKWSVRGLIALAKGDLSSARLFLARAADAGDPRAWVALADTYDPAMLTKLGVIVAPGDAQRAKDYLVKAAAAGVVVKDRMAALDSGLQNAH